LASVDGKSLIAVVVDVVNVVDGKAWKGARLEVCAM
jgi:hypothetical protein